MKTQNPNNPKDKHISELNIEENYEFGGMPRSDRNEVALLSAMMLQPSAARATIDYGMTEEDFYDPRNSELFHIFKTMMEEGKPLDLALVSERLASGFPDDAYLCDVFTYNVCGTNWKYYCEILKEKTLARKAIEAGMKLKSLGYEASDRVEASVTKELDQLRKELTGTHSSNTDIEAALVELADELEEVNPPERFGFDLPELDFLFKGGFQRGELAVVAGMAKGGKSILLGMAILEAIRRDKRVLCFNLEMPTSVVLRRIATNYAGAPIKGRSEYPLAREMDAAMDAIAFLHSKSHHLGMSDQIRTIEAIESKCSQATYDLIVVDYLQLVQCEEGDNREQQVSAVARRLKDIAATRNAVVLTASQLNDEGRTRESRAIGMHTDHLISINESRDQLCVVANRRGPSGTIVNVRFRGDLFRFEQI